jgi:ATP-binding cassette subfamily C protein
VIAQHRTLAKLSHRQGTEIFALRNGLYRILADAAQLRKTLSNPSAVSMTAALSGYRTSLSDTRGHFSFISTVPRYLLELTLAIGILVMGGVAYLASGPTQALTAVVLFTGVSFRLLPVVNRIQVLALTIINNIPTAKLIFEMPRKAAERVAEQPQETGNLLEMLGVNFQYSKLSEQVLCDINLSVKKGKQYAIVGPSGAGKTTLVDIFLGLLHPTSGAMRRDKMSASAYVAQETHIAFMSLAENVALVWNWSDVDPRRVESALKRAGLHEFLTRIDDPTPLLNESLSGGQKQRIGLARAFYSGADFIVLDEVTSALDAETEKGVVEQIYELRGDVTAVIVAHRLSTVQHADHVFYLENGQLIGSDTFQALADTLPQFRQQIELGQIYLHH